MNIYQIFSTLAPAKSILMPVKMMGLYGDGAVALTGLLGMGH